MKIASEQEMLAFGKDFAKHVTGGVAIAKGAPHGVYDVGEDSNRQYPSSILIELIGDVGAGKTTFVRGLAEGLGIKENITSPSFTISKTYALPNSKTLTHYDFYRLNNPGLMQEDLKEKIKENNIIIIEWANSVANILPKNRIKITITKNDDDSRTIVIQNNRTNIIEGLPETAAEDERQSPVKTSARNATRNDIVRLYLDTSTPKTILKLNDKTYEWDSGHELAEKLLKFIHEKLKENDKSWQDITEITFMSGPGSFTGLRIGATVVNTLASELNIPLYDHNGKQVKIILPNYGRDANISKPKK